MDRVIYQGRARYPVKEVMLHTSATNRAFLARHKTVEHMMAEVRRWHMTDNLWRDIGYHRGFSPSGRIGLGRSLWDIGAGCKGRNRGIVHLVLFPKQDITCLSDPLEWYAERQLDSVRDYIQELKQLTPLERVTGHNQFANKLCPGFIVKTEDWL